MIKGLFRGKPVGWPTALCVHGLAAALLMAPAFFLGTWNADSFEHNVAWTKGVAAEMAQGWFYPRWLTTGFEGLGSPSFYFYPPLPFLVTGAVKLFAGHLLTTNAILQLYAAVVLAGSGLAMWIWLRRETSSPAALFGSLAYLAMPYHLADHYLRGALGEFTAYLFLPLLFAAIRRASRGEAGGLTACSLIYAALILSHVPSALLISIFAVPVYATWLLGFSRARLSAYASLLGAFALGASLSALYLVPALLLQEHISTHLLWSGHYQASRWLVWNVLDYPDFRLQLLLAIYLMLTGALLATWTNMRRQKACPPDIRFFAFWMLGLMALLLGVFPPLWDLPLLSSVQFPWRMLVIVDALWAYAAARALSTTASGRGVAPLWISLGCATFVSSLLFVNMSLAGNGIYQRGAFKAHEPLEYLPAGITTHADMPPHRGKVIPPSAGAVAVAWENGKLRVHVRTGAPATVVLPIYYFPAWNVYQADQKIESGPATSARLLSFQVDAVSAEFTAERDRLPEEWIGGCLSLMSLVIIVAATWFGRLFRARQREPVRYHS